MDLDSLSKIVQERAGISKESADIAVRIVLEKVKERLPAPAQPMVDKMLSGEAAGGAGGGLGSMLGGLMGGE